jgi:hypothetical protein
VLRFLTLGELQDLSLNLNPYTIVVLQTWLKESNQRNRLRSLQTQLPVLLLEYRCNRFNSRLTKARLSLPICYLHELRCALRKVIVLQSIIIVILYFNLHFNSLVKVLLHTQPCQGAITHTALSRCYYTHRLACIQPLRLQYHHVANIIISIRNLMFSR